MQLNSEYEELYDDNEGPRMANVQSILHRSRWRWILAGIMGIAFAIPFLLSKSQVMITEIPTANSLQSAPPPPSTGALHLSSGHKQSFTLSPSEYNFDGGNATFLANFTLSSLSSQNKSLLTSIYLSNIFLDAPLFSSAIENFINLEIICLQNVWLVGNFSRVYLPRLKRFVYTQNPVDKRDSYKSPETLKTTLFFDKSPNGTWDVEKDVLNLGVDITMSKGGTKLLDICRTKQEIYLNIKYCQNVLLHVIGNYDKLTLINCNVTQDAIAVIPPTLKYLNLRNSLPPTDHLSVLLKKLVNLQEFYGWLTFHCEWPGYELFVNVSDLAKSVTTLGLNNVDWSNNPGESTAIKQLTVGSFMTDAMISTGLPQSFKNLAKLNIVNVSDPDSTAAYRIIHQGIKMGIKEISVVNLLRNETIEVDAPEEVVDVENILSGGNYPKESISCFVLLANSNIVSSTGVGYTIRPLNTTGSHMIRYEGLGFNKMDSFDDYVKWDAL